MKVDSFDISLSSQYNAARYHRVQESMTAWQGGPPPELAARPRLSVVDPVAANQTEVAISDAARQQAAAETTGSGEVATERQTSDSQLTLLVNLVEQLTGQKIRLFDTQAMQAPSQAAAGHPPPEHATAHPRGPAMGRSPAASGMEYSRSERLYEMEQFQFAAEGTIRTEDGQEINFNFSLSMQREFYQQSDSALSATGGQRKDPLVVNFNGSATELTSTKFSFDIDVDGHDDEISFVGANSGFLALDNNRNGKVDDGSELFGTRSGNGFAELAGYDSDGNQWIDENDPVYEQLQVWTKDQLGNDILSSLKDSNVGALYLGNVATPLALNDAQNTQHGQLRDSGVYLQEDGNGVGALQQIDLMA